jgi:hypothetical protein
MGGAEKDSPEGISRGVVASCGGTRERPIAEPLLLPNPLDLSLLFTKCEDDSVVEVVAVVIVVVES